MANLMVHKDVLKNFGSLPVIVQKKVAELIGLFEKDPHTPSLHLHALKETMADAKVRGVNLPNGYRGIVIAPDKGECFLLMHVDKHDDAYAWAKNKRFEVHGATGTFQVFDVQEAKAALPLPPSRQHRSPEHAINRLSDEDLFHAGVPKALIPSIRAIRTDDDFEAVADYLPQDCREVLYGIACGMSLDDALELTLGKTPAQMVAAEPAGPGDFSKLREAATFDLLLVEGEEHLKSILTGSFEEWRLFLHPSQRKVVEWETRGPMNVNGAAGTGKTVALMHRAVHLLKRMEDPQARILVTTFTTNLGVTIKGLVKKLAAGSADRVEVTNLHALARTICTRSGWRGRIAERDDMNDIWDDVCDDASLGEMPMKREELKLEYDLVIDSNGIEDEDSYLTTVRTGRPRIQRTERKHAWPFFRAVQRELKKRSLLTFEGAIHQARLAVEQGGFPKYAHVLVDEVQDFSLEALRLIRALSPIDAGGRDPLCTFGDGHQRIYRVKIPLSRAGIETRGRSRRLRINYRTTEQIRQWAEAVLAGVEVDDLEGGKATTVGDRSVMKGQKPEIVRCADAAQEAKSVASWATRLIQERGLEPHQICVTPYRSEIRSALQAAGLETFELKPREEDPGPDQPGVRLGTMHRIKGLEFRAVAMACADAGDAMNRADPLEEPRERCLRYVAATRAREYLLVAVAGELIGGGPATGAGRAQMR